MLKNFYRLSFIDSVAKVSSAENYFDVSSKILLSFAPCLLYLIAYNRLKKGYVVSWKRHITVNDAQHCTDVLICCVVVLRRSRPNGQYH